MKEQRKEGRERGKGGRRDRDRREGGGEREKENCKVLDFLLPHFYLAL